MGLLFSRRLLIIQFSHLSSMAKSEDNHQTDDILICLEGIIGVFTYIGGCIGVAVRLIVSCPFKR